VRLLRLAGSLRSHGAGDHLPGPPLIIAQWPTATINIQPKPTKVPWVSSCCCRSEQSLGFCLRRAVRTAPNLRRLVEDLRGHAVNDLSPVGIAHVRSQTNAWRAATVASALVCVLLIACLMLGTGHASITAHVIEVMR
jgi:hypothetical protein